LDLVIADNPRLVFDGLNILLKLHVHRVNILRDIAIFTRATYTYVRAVLATATWPAGWLAVTRLYCIKTAKLVLKLFRPSGSPIILVCSDPEPIPNSNENPCSGAINTPWVGKNWRFSTEIAVYFGNGAT